MDPERSFIVAAVVVSVIMLSLYSKNRSLRRRLRRARRQIEELKAIRNDRVNPPTGDKIDP
jgi:cell division protein FtsL